MRLATMLLLSVFLLGFGCLEQNSFPSDKAERLSTTQPVDLDGDGIADYAVYVFAPATGNASGMTLQRTVTVAAETAGEYTALRPNMTITDALLADESLKDFSDARTQAEGQCSAQVGMGTGLGTVICTDVQTCAGHCSGASVKCKRIAAVYDEVLAGSIMSYTQDLIDMRNLLIDARRMVVTLDSATPEEKDAYLAKTRGIVAKIAQINANPLYAHPDVNLCSHSDFGISSLLDAAGKIGIYESAPVSYRYTVLLSAKPVQSKAETIGVEVSGIGFTDRLPKSAVQKSEYISSIQSIAAVESGSDVSIVWNSAEASKEGYLFAYSFTSTAPPEMVLASFRVPTLTVKQINLSVLSPTERLFMLLNGLLKNYYIALGLALGITVAVLMLAYNALLLIMAVIAERALTPAFRKAFGKTSVTWKTDSALAAIALAAGAYVCLAVAAQPAATPTLVESFDFLVTNGTGMVGLAFILIGVLLAYLAIENMVKILMLEAAYGMVIRHEKDAFLSEAARLKEKLKELEALIDQRRQENLDVSHEYDTLASITPEKVDALAKNMTVPNKTLIDEYTERVDNAIKSLADKSKLAEENWQKWSEEITKVLNEQEEVYPSAISSIPVSLRTWALGRYVKEHAAEGIIMEHDAIKRRKITAEHVVHELLEHKMIRGAIVLKEDKIEHVEFADTGGATVRSALALKLRTYINSLAKNTGQKEPVSMLVIGITIAMVYMRGRTRDCFLFVNKEKFSEAIEQWKTKTKMLE
ncbi:MAG: DUF4795 domain-containing protein [Candidatus ainarchaeum sp.]|nr:DUF4795 domain-containing protein [Candidatus ainarchaeum sp.]